MHDKEIKVFDINIVILFTKFNNHTNKIAGVKVIKDKDNNPYYVSYSGDILIIIICIYGV